MARLPGPGRHQHHHRCHRRCCCLLWSPCAELPALLLGSTLAAVPGLPAAGAPVAAVMSEEDYYLELCERPVQFEKANPVNCVFFDEANKQVGACGA